MKLETIIGLEIHVQLKTKSKMFCRCDNTGEDQPPNTTICPVCLGHPGTLPLPNKPAIDWAVLTALALNCQVKAVSKFDRKHYFYPDLPKGFQISQYDQPIGQNGYLDVSVPTKKGAEVKHIRINRLHLEEDAAKNVHQAAATLVDFNRAGTPLMEIVSEPDIKTPMEAKIFLQELRQIILYLGVSLADMEKGHLRCDANLSLRPAGDNRLYPKTEVKNMNSFKAVERALTYEIQRQTKLWQEKKPPAKLATRGWDEKKQVTVEQRVKEEAQDYRYFPEPDIPPLKFTASWLQQIKLKLPELPQVKRQRFIEMYGLSPEYARLLTETKALADYTEQVISELKAWLIASGEGEGDKEEVWHQNKQQLVKLIGNWLTRELFKLLSANQQTIEQCKITPENFAEFIQLSYQNKINSSQAQVLLREMFVSGGDPSQIIEAKDLKPLAAGGELDTVLKQVIKANASVVADYKKGKDNAIMYLVGQAMKATKSKANPQEITNQLKRLLTK